MEFGKKASPICDVPQFESQLRKMPIYLVPGGTSKRIASNGEFLGAKIQTTRKTHNN